MNEASSADEGPLGRVRGDPDAVRHDVVRAARVRVVGTAFLTWRPLVVLPVVATQMALSTAAMMPAAQRLALGVAMVTTLSLFAIEARLVRTRVVTERWLFGSLATTALLITLGLVLSGGIASPLLVLTLAPLVVAFAAFGRRRATAWLLGCTLVVVALVALVSGAGALPWGPLPAPWVDWMRLVAFAGTLALAWTGVARLADAHAEAGALLERMRHEAVLAATTRLREAEEVSARVAHELKNPLAAMKALVQLEARDASERSAQRLEVVLREIDRMSGLVTDHLALARAHVALSREPTDLAELVGDVIALLTPRAENRAVRLVAEVRPARGNVDRARLREAVLNLVDNAVQASPPGGVVTVTLDAREVTIADRGAGLDPRVAAAFASGDTAWLTTRAEGTGLGLAITRAIVHAHGGQLTLRAREGGGTVARIALPEEVS